MRSRSIILLFALCASSSQVKAPRVWARSEQIEDGHFEVFVQTEVVRGWAAADLYVHRGSPKWDGVVLLGLDFLPEPLPLQVGAVHVNMLVWFAWLVADHAEFGGGKVRELLPGDGLISYCIDSPNDPEARLDAWLSIVTPALMPEGIPLLVQIICRDEAGRLIGGPVFRLTSGPTMEVR
jgi:hypothetical protein